MPAQCRDDGTGEHLALMRVEIAIEIPGPARAQIAADR